MIEALRVVEGNVVATSLVRWLREARIPFALPCVRGELQNGGVVPHIVEAHDTFVSVPVPCKLVVEVRSVQVFSRSVHTFCAWRHDSRDALVISPVRVEPVDRCFLQRFADISRLLPFRRDDLSLR